MGLETSKERNFKENTKLFVFLKGKKIELVKGEQL